MTMQTPSSIPIVRLSEAQRHALEVIATQRIVRVTGGWRGRGTPLIRTTTAQVLIAAQLAHVVTADGRKQIFPTAAGRVILRRGGM